MPRQPRTSSPQRDGGAADVPIQSPQKADLQVPHLCIATVQYSRRSICTLFDLKRKCILCVGLMKSVGIFLIVEIISSITS